MAARKNKDGIWCDHITAPKNARGKTRRIWIQCPKDYNTLEMLDRLKRAAIDRHMAGLFTASGTFEGFVTERFLKEYPAANNLRASSEVTLRYLLTKLGIPLVITDGNERCRLGDLPLVSIDAVTMGRVWRVLRERMRVDKEGSRAGQSRRAISDQTIHLLEIAIVSVLRWAKLAGELSQVPDIGTMRIPRAQRPAPYTQEEALRMIAKAQDDEERALFLCIFDAAMRQSEIFGLTREQIDFQHNRLTIDRQLCCGRVGPTKGGRERVIPMSDALASALRKIRHVRSIYVFADEEGAPRRRTWLKAIWFRAAKDAGLRRTRIHDGRHAAATMHINNGMNPFELQKFLGHQDIKTTEGYVHVTLPKVRSVMDVG